MTVLTFQTADSDNFLLIFRSLIRVGQSREEKIFESSSKVWLVGHLQSFSARSNRLESLNFIRSNKKFLSKVSQLRRSLIMFWCDADDFAAAANDRQSTNDLNFLREVKHFWFMLPRRGRGKNNEGINWAPFEKRFGHKSSFNLRSRACNLAPAFSRATEESLFINKSDKVVSQRRDDIPLWIASNFTPLIVKRNANGRTSLRTLESGQWF